jgi:hypothetical protein
MPANSDIRTERRGVGDNTYYLVKVGGTVVGHHSSKAAAAKQVMYLKRARKEFQLRSNPRAAHVPVGKWLRAKVNPNGTITLAVPAKRYNKGRR